MTRTLLALKRDAHYKQPLYGSQKMKILHRCSILGSLFQSRSRYGK